MSRSRAADAPARLDIAVRDPGHAFGVDPGNLWFSGRVTDGPKAIVGRRVVVHLTDEEATRLVAELQTILSARRARHAEGETTL